MADTNLYLRYKSDERRLPHWMTYTISLICTSEASETPVAVHTAGGITVAQVKSMAKLIAAHVRPVPTIILRLFNGIIAARQEVHKMFQRITDVSPDSRIEESNARHSFWIEGLVEAFSILGADAWLSGRPRKSEGSHKDEDEALFAHAFSCLGVRGLAKIDGPRWLGRARRQGGRVR